MGYRAMRIDDVSIDDVIRDKRNDILRIAANHGAHNVRIFGSTARGEATSTSDVDLLVTFASGQSLMDHAGLQLELEELLGRRVEIASDRGLKPRVRRRILAEAVSL